MLLYVIVVLPFICDIANNDADDDNEQSKNEQEKQKQNIEMAIYSNNIFDFLVCQYILIDVVVVVVFVETKLSKHIKYINEYSNFERE